MAKTKRKTTKQQKMSLKEMLLAQNDGAARIVDLVEEIMCDIPTLQLYQIQQLTAEELYYRAARVH